MVCRIHSRQKYSRNALLGLLSMALLGCSSDMSDLENYIEKTHARPGIPIKPLPEITAYEPKPYDTASLRNPFASYEEWERANETTTVNNDGPKPVAGRIKEPLEGFPLDALRMVGLLEDGSKRFALVRSSEPLVYRVQVGDYMGQNHGQVIKITQKEIFLSELVLNGLGGWDERQTSVALSEAESK